MTTLKDLICAIPPLDHAAMQAAEQHINGLAKPPRSLGRLEDLAIHLAGMPGIDYPDNLPKEIIVMCADHGVFAEGVAVTPQEVTAIQARNIQKQLTGVCAVARSNGTSVLPVDIGIDCDPIDDMISLKLARGCGNIAKGPAMSYADAEHLLVASAELVKQRVAAGIRVVGTGELGIANTTPASAMISVLCGLDPHDTVGIGANLPLDRVSHKEAIVRQAIALNKPDPADAIDVLAKVGGYDLTGMTGVILGAAVCGIPVVLDGFLSYACAIAACRLAPAVRDYLIPSHFSAEKGAGIALEQLGLKPFLYLDLRLGEGSGAALAMSVINAACSMYCHMGHQAGSGFTLPPSPTR
ncbi:TPA: nicotinate-nucleotide--dimethylbenzimidazole phosphoribosyltransferase [Morganella morganii]